MKVKELLAYLEKCKDDLDIVILTNNIGFGSSPYINVISATTGIDWDSGKLLLKVEKPIIEDITE